MNIEAPIIIATGNPAENSRLESVALKNKVYFFSGSEDDVLERFIDCAGYYGLTKVLRVCADNPFLDIDLTRELIETYLPQDYDYVSYSINQKPAILSHYGFFAELVRADALLNAHGATKQKTDREHVTPYLYNNPNKFSVKLVEAPIEIKTEKNIRLTVDTQADFMIAGVILKQLLVAKNTVDYNYNDILSVLKKASPEIITGMQQQIIENSKS